MFKTIAMTFAIGCFVAPVKADPLLSGGKVVKIANTRGASDASFVILTQGGNGPCSNGWIYFYPTGASTPEMQKRAYAAVMLAIATGMRIDVEAPTGSTSCLDAYFVATYQ